MSRRAAPASNGDFSPHKTLTQSIQTSGRGATRAACVFFLVHLIYTTRRRVLLFTIRFPSYKCSSLRGTKRGFLSGERNDSVCRVIFFLSKKHFFSSSSGCLCSASVVHAYKQVKMWLRVSLDVCDGFWCRLSRVCNVSWSCQSSPSSATRSLAGSRSRLRPPSSASAPPRSHLAQSVLLRSRRSLRCLPRLGRLRLPHRVGTRARGIATAGGFAPGTVLASGGLAPG